MRRKTTRSELLSVPRPTRDELRTFGLLMAAVLGAVGLVLWYLAIVPASWWSIGTALAFVLSAVLVPAILKLVYIPWMILARLLGFANSHILLALIFYSMFAVGGLIMRIVRYDPMDRRFRQSGGRRGAPTGQDGRQGDEDGDSYWTRRESTLLPANHYERQF